MIDIIRANCVADGYKFKSIVGEQLLAEVDMEMCFGYGMFGYGYSNQLLNAGKVMMMIKMIIMVSRRWGAIMMTMKKKNHIWRKMMCNV